jgi:diguanylate cyclase (GGDEF)-like protein
VLAHASRTGEPVTVALLDLDRFKEVNDQSGHEAGDRLLCELTARWSAQLRQADLLGRYGGDEFVLCLPGTDAAGSAEILARLDASHPFSWSVGTATAVDGDTLSSMLSRADAQLYRHKRESRTN